MHATGLTSTRDLPMTRTDPAVARMPPPDMPAEPHTAPLHVAQDVPQLQPVLQQHEAVQTVASPLHYAPHASAFHSVQQFFPVEYGMRDDGRFAGTAGCG